MLNLDCSSWFGQYSDHVETTTHLVTDAVLRQKMPGGSGNFAAFVEKHRFRGLAEKTGRFRSDFDKNENFTVPHDQVDFTAAHTIISGAKTHPLLLQEIKRDVFTAFSELLPQSGHRLCLF